MTARIVVFALAIGLALIAALAVDAWGQSMPSTPTGPGWYYGYQPGNDGFNKAFAAKQDWPLPAYTVATLPACTSAIGFSWAVITDATTPTYNGTPVGSGAVVVPVFCNGVTWKTH